MSKLLVRFGYQL